MLFSAIILFALDPFFFSSSICSSFSCNFFFIFSKSILPALPILHIIFSTFTSVVVFFHFSRSPYVHTFVCKRAFFFDTLHIIFFVLVHRGDLRVIWPGASVDVCTRMRQKKQQATNESYHSLGFMQRLYLHSVYDISYKKRL